MSYKLSDVERLCKLAREAGALTETWDYGFSAGAHFLDAKRSNILIAEVFRAERDGYVGSRIICQDVLEDWLKTKKKKAA